MASLKPFREPLQPPPFPWRLPPSRCLSPSTNFAWFAPLYKWSPTECAFLCLASSTLHYVCEINPPLCLVLLLLCISLYKFNTICSSRWQFGLFYFSSLGMLWTVLLWTFLHMIHGPSMYFCLVYTQRWNFCTHLHIFNLTGNCQTAVVVLVYTPLAIDEVSRCPTYSLASAMVIFSTF